ncbi:MAG: amino acid ABC transporter permease [Candidatus Dormiibacterota bacterium]
MLADGDGVDPGPLVVAGGPPSISLGAGGRHGKGGKRAIAISTVSTIIILGVLLGGFFFAPGSAVVRQTFFNLKDARTAFFGDPRIGIFSEGSALLLNIAMFLSAEVLILILAMVIAMVRQLRGPVSFPFRMLAIAYTDFFRGVPLILVIYAIGFGVPALYLAGISYASVFVYGEAALVLSYSAYVSEVYRAGIESVHPSQVAAARSLGLSQWQSMRSVVIPQAVRRVIPPLLNDFISLQKDTALVSVLGVIEVNRAAGIVSSTDFNYTGYTVAALLFLLLTVPLARFTDFLIARDRRRRQAGIAR